MKIFYILLIFILGFTSAFAQSFQVKGTVTNEQGEALPGVSIVIQGTKTGTQSDINGHYAINVPQPNAVLVFSIIGSTHKNVEVAGRRSINVSLAEEISSLDEVQVVGFGVQKKASVVGAISNVDMKELRIAAPSNLSDALGGRIPGLVARMGDGAVGGVQNRYQSGSIDDGQIFIRGRSTFNSAGALVLIDGVEGSLSRINPEDIDQFSVLKDASATAVYGVRGANGVILITTKKGAIGKPKITVHSQLRMMKPLDFPKFLGSYDYATLYDEAQKNVYTAQVQQGIIPSTQTFTPLYSASDLEHYRTGDDPYGHSDVNTYDLLYKDHFYEQQHIGNISGGTDKATYYISGEYDQAGGIVKGVAANGTNYNYRRYNLRSNLDFTVTKTTKLSVNLNGLLNDLNSPLTGDSSGQRVNGVGWYYIVTHRPNDGQPYNPNGTNNWGLGPGWIILPEILGGGYFRRITNALTSSFNLNQDLSFITPGLSFRGLYGMSYNAGSTKQLNKGPAYYSYDAGTGVYTLQKAAVIPNYSAIGDGFQPFGRTQQLEWVLNYNKTINKDHNITALAAFTQSTNESGYVLPRYYQGVSGRVTYAYKSKYLLEGNVGYNGSDAFNKDRRYGFFPAVSGGWVVTEEPFMKSIANVMDYLKIRGSYGEVGNDRLNGALQYFYQYNFAAPTAPGTSNGINGYYSLGLNGVNQIGLVEGTLGNDQVTWETAHKSDIGFESKFFHSRLGITGDVFLEKRSNILAQKLDVPYYTALLSAATSRLPALNVGRMTNKGFELSMDYADHAGAFQYSIEANYTYVHNNIDYMGEALKSYPWLYKTGHPYGTEALYTWTGKFYSAEDIANPKVAKPAGLIIPGDLVYQDLNGDGVINSDDQAYQGYTEIPEKVFGLNLFVQYKSFYLSTNWYGAANVAYRPSGPLLYEFANNIQPYQMEGRWVYDPSRGLDTRATATYPALEVNGSQTIKMASTFSKYDARYIRLRAVEFGYDLPKSFVKKLHMAGIKVYINGENLLTFSPLNKYHIDPEYIGASNTDGASNGSGTGVYSPQNKFFGAGLNVTF